MALALVVSTQAHADDVCDKVKKVFWGLNEIAHRGNTSIIPFTREYEADLIYYFGKGCPQDKNFPLPDPGTDMSLANTASDIITGGGGLKFRLGEPLRR
jgi:hypothetical protein